MAWQVYRWVWQLESPLHIGLVPAGILNRTRLYIPARTMWGGIDGRVGATGFLRGSAGLWGHRQESPRAGPFLLSLSC